MRKLLFVLFLFASLSAQAQDPIFSQFYAAPLQLNPAFAGSGHAPRLGAAYRNQWSGFNNAYRTYAAFYEQSIDRLNSGIGFNLEGDDAGDGILRTTRFSAVYAYRLNITGNLAVKIGVEAGLQQTALDWDRLVFPDQIDPLDGPVITTTEQRPDQLNNTVFDASSGLLLLSDRFWLGLGLKHLNTPRQGFLLVNDNLSGGLPLRYTLHGGTEIIVNRGNKVKPASFISPNFLLVSQGPYKQLNVGAYTALGPVFGGAWYRHTFRNADAAILMLGFRQDMFKIGLSYDITVSSLAARSGGTYELTFGLFFDKGRKRPADLNDCTGMFH
ncbi:MAG: type IX secretion system membrane protein PorP/SprF [Saprospirales bacterium]|nr:type IX secretion system membrane protein PorP/SprF [Saprospirales bacterium]MBK8923638.1 type IX secretion system membrane protein PorP/SprF [Saprospirales bacterium]